MSKPALGEFHRQELAILGTTCGNIKKLVNQVISGLSARFKLAYIDADHQPTEPEKDAALAHGAAIEFTDHISHRSFNYQQTFNSFQNRQLYNGLDMVLINGNHFQAQSQIVVIDAAKPLQNKLNRLNNVVLVLLAGSQENVPQYLQSYVQNKPVMQLKDIDGIAAFVQNYLTSHIAPLNGLVLAGGQSTRMQTDKGSLVYFGKSQRQHVYHQLSILCSNVFVSYASQASVDQEEGLPVVTDTFTGLGPLGGILSAFRSNPDTAWLTVACDLPYLSDQTLAYLVSHRNPTKIATCFMDIENRFPEPLITIWEPRAYPVMLQFLSQGYSCPRKILINSEVELLRVPDAHDLVNVNTPQQREEALAHLRRQD